MPRRAVEVALGLPAGAPPLPRPYGYARLDGELSAIAAAMREPGGSPGRIACDLARLAVAPGGMVDPSPLDPFLWTRTAAVAGWTLARRARAAARARSASALVGRSASA
jgi:hypothetical protein